MNIKKMTSLIYYLEKVENIPTELGCIVGQYSNIVSLSINKIMNRYLGVNWIDKYVYLSHTNNFGNNIVLYMQKEIYFKILEIENFFFIENDGQIARRKFYELESNDLDISYIKGFNIRNDFRIIGIPFGQITHDELNRDNSIGIIGSMNHNMENFELVYGKENKKCSEFFRMQLCWKKRWEKQIH